MELMIVIVIIGILAVLIVRISADLALKAKINVAKANFIQTTNFIKVERESCELENSSKIFGNNSCPITDSVPGA